jgi:hypothetical protein
VVQRQVDALPGATTEIDGADIEAPRFKYLNIQILKKSLFWREKI